MVGEGVGQSETFRRGNHFKAGNSPTGELIGWVTHTHTHTHSSTFTHESAEFQEAGRRLYRLSYTSNLPSQGYGLASDFFPSSPPLLSTPRLSVCEICVSLCVCVCTVISRSRMSCVCFLVYTSNGERLSAAEAEETEFETSSLTELINPRS